ncbi:hypothetical protein M9H77_02893 [Catharanthus roseus]|uniref:Uncharacterized protein n=1 Tax=Catharanthus roseus TaxID=4058 RepID=A0ACC0C9P1_CATRO|nr:hypothetical protein M9H77_02893 [Catharanthus roseus]
MKYSSGLSSAPHPKIDPRHSTYLLCAQEGNEAVDVSRLELSFMHLPPNGRVSLIFPIDHGLTTRSPMASGGFGIVTHVHLCYTFLRDWTHVSCRKYGSGSDFGFLKN